VTTQARLLFINPNSTAAITDSVVASARAVVPDAEVIGWTNADGPPSIEGAADGAAAEPGLMALIDRAAGLAPDVIAIACFDDTGLDAARARAHCPVIGIGQAAYHLASLSGASFAVLTSVPAAIPVLEGNIRAQGFSHAALPVAASGYSPVALEDGDPDILAALGGQIAGLAGQGAGSVILGCAGMSRHRDALQARAPVLLIDGVRAAARLGQAIAAERHASGFAAG
jgi:allantoin racemase